MTSVTAPAPYSGIVYPMAHASIAWGYALALYVAIYPRYPHLWFWAGIAVLLVVTLAKEMLVGPIIEGPTELFLWAGVWDWSNYWMGLGLAGLFLPVVP